jgi:hypothetical protein
MNFSDSSVEDSNETKNTVEITAQEIISIPFSHLKSEMSLSQTNHPKRWADCLHITL